MGRSYLAYIAFTLVVTGLLAACGWNSRPPSVPGQYFATVEARQGWQDSGITVAAGDTVTITYSSGQWTHFPREVPPFSGGIPPDEYTYICAEGIPAGACVEQIPDFQTGALIGRAGSQLLKVGSRLQFTAESEGPLLLRINDGDDGLHDNEGKITLVVDLEADR